MAEFVLQEFYIGFFLRTEVSEWRLKNKYGFQNTIYNLPLNICGDKVVK
jgi:hypothetical protein